MRLPQCRSSFSCPMMWAVVFLLGCGGPAPLTVDMPLHLEEHLDAATIVGSEVPADVPQPVEWRFDEPQPGWRAAEPIGTQMEAVEPVRGDDALRLPLTEENRGTNRMFAMIYVELPDWKLEDWAYVEIRARTRDPMLRVGLQFNYTEEDPEESYAPFYVWGDRAPLVTDGTVQTYRLSLDWPRMRRWEGPGGQRFSQPVSMIDVLPTILNLAGLPMPDVTQGQSLAPLLLGEFGWEPRPVILDEFEVDSETGEFRGQIEVIDGRWGASLEINPDPEQPPESQRPVPLLLYDLWNDPSCLHSLHEERPDLVQKFTAFLEAQFAAHQALAQLFTPSESVALTPEQLETLRALGYIQ